MMAKLFETYISVNLSMIPMATYKMFHSLEYGLQ